MPKRDHKFLTLTLSTTFAAALLFAVITACTGEQAKAKPNIVHKTGGAPGVVAKIGGETITEEMLVGEDKMDFFELKKREYDLKMDRIKKMMVDKLVGAEAKSAGMSTEDFINKKIVGGEIKINDKDFRKFVEEKHIPESQINPQIKERIFQYLQTMKKQDLIEAHVAKLTKSNPVEVFFSKPKMNVNVEVGKSPVFGSQNAAVTIIEFSDFQCPFCSRAAATVSEIKKKYGNKIKLAFKHFPLPMHREARPAAEAAMCVAEQSADKFWKFHDLVFKNQDKLDAASLEKAAKESGADVSKYGSCVSSKKFAADVQKDLDYGEKIGVKSTPTFFVNGQIINGAVPIEQFSEIIDDELSEHK